MGKDGFLHNNKMKRWLRNWLFADYKWITRAQVRAEIYSLMWDNRDRPFVKRQLLDLLDRIK